MISDSKTIALGNVIEAVETWNPSLSGPGETFEYIDLGAIDQDTKRIIGARTVQCVEAPSRARQLVATNDVLVSTVRPNLNGIAKVPRELDGATASTGFCVLRARTSVLDAGYLFQWVKTPTFVSDMVRKATGASYPAVSDRIIAESRIPLPTIDEQRRIAGIMDKADELRTKRRSSLAQLDALTRAIFLDMFGDPATNPRGWQIRSIGEVTECLDRIRKPVTESDRVAGPIPYYGANGLQGWINRALFDEPLVLVAEDGGYFDTPERGVAYRIDGPAWVNNHAHILRAVSSYLETEFLHRALKHYNFVPYISGTTRAKLTQGQLGMAKLIIPPLGLQRDFADRVIAAEELTAVQSRSLAKMNEFFTALQCRAFIGEL